MLRTTSVAAMHDDGATPSCTPRANCDAYAADVGDGLPLLSDALSTALTPTLREWHDLLSKTKRFEPPPNDMIDTPCLVWRGAANFRYRGRRWTAQRLFYLLTRGADPPPRQPVVTACGRGGCVAHVVVDRWRPPRKRGAGEAFEAAPRVDGMTLAERERCAALIVDEMHAELAHLDAIGAPPGRELDIDEEDARRLERRALEASAVEKRRRRQRDD